MIYMQENVLKCKENRKMQVSNKVTKARYIFVVDYACSLSFQL